MGWWSDAVDIGLGKNAPAIWLYPPKRQHASVHLKFQRRGFMTISAPSYNQGWLVDADASGPLPVVQGTYDGGPAYTYLDYDGFRDGEFQTTSGWVVEQRDLLRWQRAKLAELGFADNEIDDVNYAYGRLLLMRGQKERFFLVYPQVQSIVDHSVSLQIEPKPDSTYRLWLYFVPSNDPPPMEEPQVPKVVRRGFAAIELGFLTDAEMPGAARTATQGATTPSATTPQPRMLRGLRGLRAAA